MSAEFVTVKNKNGNRVTVRLGSIQQIYTNKETLACIRFNEYPIAQDLVTKHSLETIKEIIEHQSFFPEGGGDFQED